MSDAETRYARLDDQLEALLHDLTHKQQLFCREYFICLNGRKAAQAAGYKGNANTLRAMGSENMAKPAIIAVMDAFFERKASDIEINAGLIEREYWKLYNVCLNDGDKGVARQCLKDLGEHHAMFIKVVASAEASELALRLAGGRSRMNDARKLRASGESPAPQAVGDEPPAL